jgi:HAD superfamily hydrolase (TIGR01490 family)
MATVIFDLDGTITRKDTYFPFLFRCARAFGVRWETGLRLPFYFLAFSSGMITRVRLKEMLFDAVLSEVRLECLKPIVESYVGDVIARRLNRPLFQMVQDHLKRGDRVILATASLDLYVQQLSERLGITNVVCTRTEVVRGVVTGRLLGENCRGQEKINQLERYLTADEWDRSIFYTDHHSDLPLLQRVSRGFLVNPGLLTRLLFVIKAPTLPHISKWTKERGEALTSV